MAKILLVDDEKDIRGMVKLGLELDKHEVIACENFAQAKAVVDQLKATSEAVDMVIADLTLPDGNGADIARECIILGTRVAILITGHSLDDDLMRDMNLDPMDPRVMRLRKPFTTKPIRTLASLLPKK